jgi:hypothetical protein
MTNYTTQSFEGKNYLLQFFAYEHLPAHLQEISKPFGDLARQIETDLPNNPEKTVAFTRNTQDNIDEALKGSLK